MLIMLKVNIGSNNCQTCKLERIKEQEEIQPCKECKGMNGWLNIRLTKMMVDVSGSACSLTFQMWLHPRQPWQLWSHPFHGCCQEWTHICGQDAVRATPGRTFKKKKHYFKWCRNHYWSLLVSVRGISNSQRSSRSSAVAPGLSHWPAGGAEVPGAGSKRWREPESERYPAYSSALCCKGKILTL